MGHLTIRVVETLPDAADADAAVMYVLKVTDADSGDTSYEQYQLIDGAMVLVGHELPDISGYQTKLVGTAGQMVGFDADGNAVAQDVATLSLPVGTDGQVVGYDADGNVVAMDLPESADEVDHIELNEQGTLTDSGGYIDFHYAGSTKDYTSRIIESAQGTVNIMPNLNVGTRLTVNNRPAYYYIVSTGTVMGFTAQETVDPATFLTKIWNLYGHGAVIKILWSYAERIHISDGTNTIELSSGMLWFSCPGDPATWAYCDLVALFIPSTGDSIYRITARSQSTAGTFTSQSITEYTPGGTGDVIIPTSQPTSLQAGAIWLTT